MKKQSNTALWQLSFRPFFLFGGMFSAISIALWLAFLFAGLPYRGYLPPVIWHAHEMIYGYATAIIAGFVLTAVQNWTGQRGVQGLKLQILFALWVLSRILLTTLPQASVVAAVIDLAFYPLLASYLIPYLRDPELKIERIFLAYFALFFAGNLLIHLESLGMIVGYSRKAVLLGLNTMIVVIIFMGGRVIPFFTESSIARAQPRTFPVVEILSHISAWLFLFTQFFMENSLACALAAFFAAAVNLVRLGGWYVRRIRRIPLIWVLHLGYFSIVLGFALSGFASLGLIESPSAVHALTVGALGMITYGMITRVSLGHTGRRLIPPASVVVGYVLLAVATLVRVFGPVFAPFFESVLGTNLRVFSISLSGLFWIVAFLLFLQAYGPMFLAPRIDEHAE